MSAGAWTLVAAATACGCVESVNFGDDRQAGVSLVGYWKLDETVGPMAADSSGLGNNGAHEGTPMPSQEVAPVVFGNPRSLTFERASRHLVAVPDSAALSLTSSLTLAAWVRRMPDSPGQGGIIEKWEIDQVSNVASRGYQFRLSDDKKIRVGLRAEPGRVADFAAQTVLPIGVWTHVAATFDGTMIYVYVDGAQDGAFATEVAPTDGTGRLHIGRDYGVNGFEGNIDEVRVYGRALTATEIMALAKGGPGPP